MCLRTASNGNYTTWARWSSSTWILCSFALLTSRLATMSRKSSLWSQGKARLQCLVRFMKAHLWIIITPFRKMAVRSPMSGIWRVPSPCLPIILVNATLVVQLKDAFSYNAFEMKRIQSIQHFFHLRLSLSILRGSEGQGSLLLPIHILVSHHLCHQGGFKDMERYVFYSKSCLLHFRPVHLATGCVNERLVSTHCSLLALLAYIKMACWADFPWEKLAHEIGLRSAK